MKKLNLFKVIMLCLAITSVSCSKDTQEDLQEINSTTRANYETVEVQCWDLNGNGFGDQDEDKNKDGIFDANDCQNK